MRGGSRSSVVAVGLALALGQASCATLHTEETTRAAPSGWIYGRPHRAPEGDMRSVVVVGVEGDDVVLDVRAIDACKTEVIEKRRTETVRTTKAQRVGLVAEIIAASFATVFASWAASSCSDTGCTRGEQAASLAVAVVPHASWAIDLASQKEERTYREREVPHGESYAPCATSPAAHELVARDGRGRRFEGKTGTDGRVVLRGARGAGRATVQLDGVLAAEIVLP